MTHPDKRHLTAVVDRSGSMHGHERDTEGGVQAVIDANRALEGKTTTFSLHQFDTAFETVHDHVDLASELPPYRLVPRGGTALHDAIGQTITTLGARLAALPEDERPSEVVVLIATDGEENSSCEFHGETIKTMVQRQTDEFGWEFLFVGANIDAIAVGTRLGFRAGQTMTYDVHDAGATRSTWSALATNSSTGSSLGYGFTDEQRRDSRGGGGE